MRFDVQRLAVELGMFGFSIATNVFAYDGKPQDRPETKVDRPLTAESQSHTAAAVGATDLLRPWLDARGEVFLGYSFVRLNTRTASIALSPTVETFHLNGGEGSFALKVNDRLGVVVDVGGYKVAALPPDVDATLTTYMSGPRFSYRKGRWVIFTHSLVGMGRFQSLVSGQSLKSPFFFKQPLFRVSQNPILIPTAFNASNKEYGFAAAPGGGVDRQINSYVSWRLQIDYLFSKFHDGSQNRQQNVKVTTGIIFRVGHRTASNSPPRVSSSTGPVGHETNSTPLRRFRDPSIVAQGLREKLLIIEKSFWEGRSSLKVYPGPGGDSIYSPEQSQEEFYLRDDVEGLANRTREQLLEACSEPELLPLSFHIRDEYPSLDKVETKAAAGAFITPGFHAVSNGALRYASWMIQDRRKRLVPKAVGERLFHLIGTHIKNLFKATDNLQVDIYVDQPADSRTQFFPQFLPEDIRCEVTGPGKAEHLYRGKYTYSVGSPEPAPAARKYHAFQESVDLVREDVSRIQCQASGEVLTCTRVHPENVQ